MQTLNLILQSLLPNIQNHFKNLSGCFEEGPKRSLLNSCHVSRAVTTMTFLCLAMWAKIWKFVQRYLNKIEQSCDIAHFGLRLKIQSVLMQIRPKWKTFKKHKRSFYYNKARTFLQTPLGLPEFFPIGQWNRFKQTEVRHLTDPLALKLVHN